MISRVESVELSFVEHARFQYEEIHLRPHKTAMAIFGTADNRLAAHIETGIDNHWATGLPFKSRKNLPIKRVGFAAHSLNSCRAINMSYGDDTGGNIGKALGQGHPRFIWENQRLRKDDTQKTKYNSERKDYVGRGDKLSTIQPPHPKQSKDSANNETKFSLRSK